MLSKILWIFRVKLKKLRWNLTQINLLNQLVKLFRLFQVFSLLSWDFGFIFQRYVLFGVGWQIEQVLFHSPLVCISDIRIEEFIHKLIEMLVFIYFPIQLLLNLQDSELISVAAFGVLFKKFFLGNFLLFGSHFSSF